MLQFVSYISVCIDECNFLIGWIFVIEKRLETLQCVLHVRFIAPTGSCTTLAIYPMSRMLPIIMQQLHSL